MILLWGCAVAPKQLYIKDLSTSFDEGTIISGKTGMPVSFEELLADLNGSRVLYVGESHTDRTHHEIQLKIIKAVFDRHQSMAVGMEMFDQSYQDVLDMWSAGELDEKTFLRKTHWYANWRYDFSLYRDILNFIKENRIRLVGLNIPSHIPPKIRVGGIQNLLNEEKKHLPKEIDTSNRAHRKYVEDVFKQHHFKGKVEFDDFYSAQSVWEDAMAEAIAESLNDDVMVVLAGNGHIQFKYGIPERAFRRTDAAFRTVYPAKVGSEVELDVADYIWVTP
jgi:uncharacterized iron-regulated protein